VSFTVVTLCVASQRVFIGVSLYFVMTQSENFWIHSRIAITLRTGRPGLESRQGLGILLFTTVSRPVLEPTQPPVRWIQRGKQPRREDEHSPPSNAEVKEGVELYLHFQCALMAGAKLKKHRDNFTLLYFTLLYFTLTSQGGLCSMELFNSHPL